MKGEYFIDAANICDLFQISLHFLIGGYGHGFISIATKGMVCAYLFSKLNADGSKRIRLVCRSFSVLCISTFPRQGLLQFQPVSFLSAGTGKDLKIDEKKSIPDLVQAILATKEIIKFYSPNNALFICELVGKTGF